MSDTMQTVGGIFLALGVICAIAAVFANAYEERIYISYVDTIARTPYKQYVFPLIIIAAFGIIAAIIIAVTHKQTSDHNFQVTTPT